MVTITSTENSIAGEISHLPAEFQFTMNLVIFFLVTSCVLLFLEQVFKNKSKTRYNKLITILMLLLVIFAISIFIFSMNELSRVCVGTIFGNGYLNLGAPGDSQFYSVSSSWGLGSGFYFYLVSIFIIELYFAKKKIVKFVKN
jgi:hypothetical protein